MAVPRPWYRGNALIALICVLPLALVAMPQVHAFLTAPQAARDAYVRSRVTASFLRTYYTDGPVATNETGLLAYETRVRLIDLSGMTNHDLAVARSRGEYDDERISREVAESGPRVAILLGPSSGVAVPQDWVLAGGWYGSGTDRESDSAVRVYSVEAPPIEVRTVLRVFSRQWEGIEFWFVEDDAAPTTRPSAIQWSGAGNHNANRFRAG